MADPTESSKRDSLPSAEEVGPAAEASIRRDTSSDSGAELAAAPAKTSDVKGTDASGANTIPAPLSVEDNLEKTGAWIRYLFIMGMVGIIAILGFSVQFFHNQQGQSMAVVLNVGFALAGASVLAGVFLGFLFGLPRLNDPALAKRSILFSNSLQQVSDWLTKILVGLGLVQIGRAPGALAQLGAAVSPALGGTPASGPFGLAIMLYYAIDGFLMGFLWSLIYVTRALQSEA
jgi:hypothetical protein